MILDRATPPAEDPATPESRLALTRELIRRAIGRYDEALAMLRALEVAYPNLGGPCPPRDEAGEAEHRAWRGLIREAEEYFDSAEEALASRIQNLHRDLDPGRPGDPDGPFVEPAVRHGGRTYVVNYDVANFEAATNIVAIVRDDRTIDLDAAPERVDADVA